MRKLQGGKRALAAAGSCRRLEVNDADGRRRLVTRGPDRHLAASAGVTAIFCSTQVKKSGYWTSPRSDRRRLNENGTHVTADADADSHADDDGDGEDDEEEEEDDEAKARREESESQERLLETDNLFGTGEIINDESGHTEVFNSKSVDPKTGRRLAGSGGCSFERRRSRSLQGLNSA